MSLGAERKPVVSTAGETSPSVVFTKDEVSITTPPQSSVTVKLAPKDVAQFEHLGITVKMLAMAGVRRVTDQQARELGCGGHRPSNQDMSGIVFPYQGLGTRVCAYRLRRDHPEFADGKPKDKYMSSMHDRRHLYIPPLGTAWENYTDVVIVESEKSALAGMCWAERQNINSMVFVASGGCWGWRGVIGNKPLADGHWTKEKGPVPEIYAICDKRVVLLFDSNAGENASVALARRTLATQLTSQDCAVSIAEVPKHPNVNGPDDLIAELGDEALATCIDKAHRELMSFDEAIQELNQEVGYVMDPGLVIRIEDGFMMDPGNFKSHHYSNRWAVAKTPKGDRAKKVAPLWLDSPYRRQFARMTYDPGRERLLEHCYNRWTGWGCAPKEGDVGPWMTLLQYFFEGADDDLRWFLQWLAYPIQNPGVKLYTAVMLHGRKHGTGKNLVAETMQKIYGSNYQLIGERELAERFNDWQLDKQFICGDEIVGSEDRRQDADKLKRIITQESVSVERKFIPRFTLRDTINYLFLSNHPNALYVEDADRRYFVWDLEDKPPMSQEFYEEYRTWKNGDGPGALFYALKNIIDCSSFNPRAHARHTRAKTAMQEFSLSEVDRWVREELRDNREHVLQKAIGDSEQVLFTTEQLLRFFDPKGRGRTSTKAMTMALTRAGFKQAYSGEKVSTRMSGRVRLWVIAGNPEPVLAMTAKEIGAIYDAEFTRASKEKLSN